MSNLERPPKARPDDAEAYPYVLTNQIGEGSFATVYRGYHVVSCAGLVGSTAKCPDEVHCVCRRTAGQLL